MKIFRYILFSIFAFLLLVTLSLWVMSHYTWFHITRYHQSRRNTINFLDGTIIYRNGPTSITVTAMNTRFEPFNSDMAKSINYSDTAGFGYFGGPDDSNYFIPFWFPALLFAAPTALALWRILRNRKVAANNAFPITPTKNQTPPSPDH